MTTVKKPKELDVKVTLRAINAALKKYPRKVQATNNSPKDGFVIWRNIDSARNEIGLKTKMPRLWVHERDFLQAWFHPTRVVVRF